jgi:thymidine kinase
MFSGKSEELLRRLRRAQIAGKKTLLLKWHGDGRFKKDAVVSHSGSEMDAFPVDDLGTLTLLSLGYDVVGIDEIQFFEAPAPIVQALAKKRIVIVSGLDMTFRGEPFGDMPVLLAVADRIDKLTAICHSCGLDATLTQRLVDGKPAPFSGDTIQVGGLDTYEARCRACWRPGDTRM